MRAVAIARPRRRDRLPRSQDGSVPIGVDAIGQLLHRVCGSADNAACRRSLLTGGPRFIGAHCCIFATAQIALRCVLTQPKRSATFACNNCSARINLDWVGRASVHRGARAISGFTSRRIAAFPYLALLAAASAVAILQKIARKSSNKLKPVCSSASSLSSRLLLSIRSCAAARPFNPVRS